MNKCIELDICDRPELFEFHGVWMTPPFTMNWEGIQNFQAKPDDVLIAGMPKAGNTWLAHIVDLLHFGDKFPEREKSLTIRGRVPYLDHILNVKESEVRVTYKGTEVVNKMTTSPRLMYSHLPVQLLPKSFWEQNCRIIYVARNAKDMVVSSFHYDRMAGFQPEPGDWSSYLKRFMEGKMLFGSWFDHVNGWWKKKQSSSNILYIFYEDLVEDTGREIDNLCSFLDLHVSAERKNIILADVQFDAMKVNNLVNQSTVKNFDFTISSFMRNGKVGDWENHFTVAQNKEFEELYKKKMTDPTLQFRTEI